MQSVEQTIFQGRSTTFYLGATFFPRSIHKDVLKLYSFLRVADDYVDCVPAKARQLHALKEAWERAIRDPQFDVTPLPDDTVDTRVIKNIVAVSKKYDFSQAWIVSFWDSMQADLDGKMYQTLADSLWYVHGSAEVVGLMMAAIMQVPPEARMAARAQGRALQWINFIRDVAEDTAMGRCYFPATDFKKFGLGDLQETTARSHPDAFRRFIQFQIRRYQKWQAEANDGLHFIPAALRPGLKTATGLYEQVAEKIKADPMTLYS